MPKPAESITHRIVHEIEQRVPKDVPVFGVLTDKTQLHTNGTPPNVSQIEHALREDTTKIAQQIRLKDKKIKKILVTSVHANEGKSTLCTALSLAFAKQGQRVLLIDGDVRKPELQLFFDIPNTEGFVDVIMYNADPKTVVQKTPIDKIFLIPAGANCIHPPSLFRRSNAGRVLKTLESRANMIIFDMCASENFAEDILKLIDNVDLVLCVYNPNVTSLKEFSQLVKTYTQIDKPIMIGVIANGVNEDMLENTSITSFTRFIHLDDLKKTPFTGRASSPSWRFPHIPAALIFTLLTLFFLIAVGSWFRQPLIQFVAHQYTNWTQPSTEAPAVTPPPPPRVEPAETEPPETPESISSEPETASDATVMEFPAVESPFVSTHPYSVHTESFQQRELALNYVKQLRQNGYEAFFIPAKVSDTIWYRVVVSGFPTEDSAKVVAEQLKRQTPDNYASYVRLPYALWLGGFTSKADAERFRQSIPENYAPYVLKIQPKQGTATYGVFVGAFEDTLDCAALSQRLTREGITNTIVER